MKLSIYFYFKPYQNETKPKVQLKEGKAQISSTQCATCHIKTYFTDVLCNRAEVGHLWGAWLLVAHSNARCPQAELLGGSVQLQVVDSGLLRCLFRLTSLLWDFCTSLEVNMRQLKGRWHNKKKRINLHILICYSEILMHVSHFATLYSFYETISTEYIKKKKYISVFRRVFPFRAIFSFI